MKRLFLVASATIALLSVPGTAAAQSSNAGCQELGQAIAGFAQEPDDFGLFISSLRPLNDDVVRDKAAICG
jgi:hypothetical protein